MSTKNKTTSGHYSPVQPTTSGHYNPVQPTTSSHYSPVQPTTNAHYIARSTWLFPQSNQASVCVGGGGYFTCIKDCPHSCGMSLIVPRSLQLQVLQAPCLYPGACTASGLVGPLVVLYSSGGRGQGVVWASLSAMATVAYHTNFILGLFHKRLHGWQTHSSFQLTGSLKSRGLTLNAWRLTVTSQSLITAARDRTMKWLGHWSGQGQHRAQLFKAKHLEKDDTQAFSF